MLVCTLGLHKTWGWRDFPTSYAAQHWDGQQCLVVADMKRGGLLITLYHSLHEIRSPCCRLPVHGYTGRRGTAVWGDMTSELSPHVFVKVNVSIWFWVECLREFGHTMDSASNMGVSAKPLKVDSKTFLVSFPNLNCDSWKFFGWSDAGHHLGRMGNHGHFRLLQDFIPHQNFPKTLLGWFFRSSCSGPIASLRHHLAGIHVTRYVWSDECFRRPRTARTQFHSPRTSLFTSLARHPDPFLFDAVVHQAVLSHLFQAIRQECTATKASLVACIGIHHCIIRGGHWYIAIPVLGKVHVLHHWTLHHRLGHPISTNHPLV